VTLQHPRGLAALICTATHLFGFALLITRFAPLGDAIMAVWARGVGTVIDALPCLPLLRHTVIYILNALALTVLFVAVQCPRAKGIDQCP